MDTKALTEREALLSAFDKYAQTLVAHPHPMKAEMWPKGFPFFEAGWQARASAPQASAQPVACPIGLDASPSICSAGTCSVCRKARDLHARLFDTPPAQDAAPQEPTTASQAGAREALAELLACEVLAGTIENADHPMPSAVREYHERRSLAMAAARAALSQPTQAQESADPEWSRERIEAAAFSLGMRYPAQAQEKDAARYINALNVIAGLVRTPWLGDQERSQKIMDAINFALGPIESAIAASTAAQPKERG
jgi:hypothetical protein